MIMYGYNSCAPNKLNVVESINVTLTELEMSNCSSFLEVIKGTLHIGSASLFFWAKTRSQNSARSDMQ